MIHRSGLFSGLLMRARRNDVVISNVRDTRTCPAALEPKSDAAAFDGALEPGARACEHTRARIRMGATTPETRLRRTARSYPSDSDERGGVDASTTNARARPRVHAWTVNDDDVS